MATYPNGVNFRFKRPQRPEADRVVFELMRAMRGHKTADIWKRTFLCQSTISKIRTRRTRYPTHLTCSAIAAAIGMKWVLVSASHPTPSTKSKAWRDKATDGRIAL